MAHYNRLLTLFHHRWNVPVIAEIYRTSGTRFVVILNKLGISRDSLTKTLKALIGARWVRRNPGYGHPLRPEYILTKRGTRLGSHCQALVKELKRLGIEESGLRKWSMPVLLAIAEGAEHFAEIKTRLPDITARALSLTLRDLQDASLVERIVLDRYPPTTRYKLKRSSGQLQALLSQIRKTLLS